MELDDLKKSWSVLDKQLQKENIVDEEQVTKLIAKYQAGARKGINGLTGLQKLSLIVGSGMVLILLLTFVIDAIFFNAIRLTIKEIVMGIFILLSISGGFWWDWRTYNFSRSIKVDEVPTVKIIEQVNEFRKKVKYELIAISVWIVLFFGLYYWMMDYYTQPLTVQLAFILGSFVLVSIAMYFIYKKVIYKHLDDIDKNLNELKELKQ